ncbi:MAG: glycosyltransferase family 4 protein [PVC group bacterium]|nr:glycosyltransferase family 4 protein [PVC group bacterium]
MKKINILHIITNLELGGAQKNALDIIEALDSARHNKFFISAEQGLLCERAKHLSEVQVYFLPELKRNISLWKDLLSLVKIISYIKRNNIELVHTHSSKAGIVGRWAAKLAGVKVIIHSIHGWSFNDYMHPIVKRVYVFLEKITSWITTSFIAVSNNDINKGIKHNIGQRKQYVLIRYGMRPPVEAYQEKKKEMLGVDESLPVVGMVACLKPQKSPLDFVRMALALKKQNVDAGYVSVGDGILRKETETLIAKENSSKTIQLLGWRTDVEKIIPLFDVVVLTSLWEGLPIALLEAMSCAKPIVAYDTDGVREIVKDGINGFLIKPGEINSLANKVKVLLQDKTLAMRMGNKGKELFEESGFKTADMMQKIEALYQPT